MRMSSVLASLLLWLKAEDATQNIIWVEWTTKRRKKNIIVNITLLMCAYGFDLASHYPIAEDEEEDMQR